MEANLAALASKAGWVGRAVYSKTLKPAAMLAKALLQEALSAATDAERFVSEGELTVSQETKVLARRVYEAYGPDILLKTEDHYNKLSPIIKWILKKKCEIGVGDYSFFCDTR